MTPFHVAAGRLPLSGLQAEYFTAEGEEDLCERPGADWSLTRRAMCVEKAIGAGRSRLRGPCGRCCRRSCFRGLWCVGGGISCLPRGVTFSR